MGMRRYWRVQNNKDHVLLEDPDEVKARAFWRDSRDATKITEVTSYGDDIALLDLLARVAKKDKSLEEDQSEDESDLAISGAVQGRVP